MDTALEPFCDYLRWWCGSVVAQSTKLLYTLGPVSDRLWQQCNLIKASRPGQLITMSHPCLVHLLWMLPVYMYLALWPVIILPFIICRCVCLLLFTSVFDVCAFVCVYVSDWNVRWSSESVHFSAFYSVVITPLCSRLSITQFTSQ